MNRQHRRLHPIAEKARERLETLFRQRFPDATVICYGLTGVDPTTLGYTLKVATNDELATLAGDPVYVDVLREMLGSLGYPRWATRKVRMFTTSLEAEIQAKDLDTWGNPQNF